MPFAFITRSLKIHKRCTNPMNWAPSPQSPPDCCCEWSNGECPDRGTRIPAVSAAYCGAISDRKWSDCDPLACPSLDWCDCCRSSRTECPSRSSSRCRRTAISHRPAGTTARHSAAQRRRLAPHRWQPAPAPAPAARPMAASAAAAARRPAALEAERQRNGCRLDVYATALTAAALEPVRLTAVARGSLRHCEASWWRCCAVRHTVTIALNDVTMGAVIAGRDCGMLQLYISRWWW